MVPRSRSIHWRRMCLTTVLIVGAGVAQPTAKARAQDSIPWPRADHLTVTVSVPGVQIRGDTLLVRYRLTSDAGSEQSGDLFAVRFGGAVVRVEAPIGWYASHGLVSDSAAVDWSSLVRRAQLSPGRTLGGFAFESVGALDVVSFLVEGHFEIPVVTDTTEGLLKQAPSPWANAFRGQTIGVVAPPADTSPSSLIARLGDRTGRVCGDLGWITNDGVCQSLSAKLANAATSIAAGRGVAAVGDLTSFVQELEAQHGPEPGKHVNDSAYWLLKVNAEFLLARL